MSLPTATKMRELKRRARSAATALEGAKAVMDGRFASQPDKQRAARRTWLMQAACDIAWISDHVRELREGITDALNAEAVSS